MKIGSVVWGLFFSAVILSGCDDKKDGFSGLSDMVGERNEIRQAISDKTAREKSLAKQDANVGYEEDAAIERMKKTEGVSTVVVYERDIEVVDSSSRMALAKGIAYLNKDGQIVKIKIIKE
jgi:hypothetical protein